MSKEHRIVIDKATGEMSFVYSDDLAPVLAQGEATVTRASHVEPHPDKAGWIADMAPSGGPVIGSSGVAWSGFTLAALEPFKTRAEALAAERAWLRENRGL